MGRHGLTGSGAHTPKRLVSQAREATREQPRASSDESLPGSGRELMSPDSRRKCAQEAPLGPPM